MKTLENKIQYLTKLTKQYVKFFKHFKKSKVEHNNNVITITYYDRKSPASYHFKKEEIPVEDVDRVILSIRAKIYREFIKRHENKYINV